MNLKQTKELVRSRLSDKRYEHTINVKKMAVKLAKHYGAFLFAEVGFWGLHCFACTVFRLLQAVPIRPQLLTLHHFQKGMFAARFFSRLLHHPLQCTA